MTTQNSSQEKPRRGPLGWSFTGREERMMANAMRLSVRFMQNYGKGRQTILVDPSHYSGYARY